MTARDTLKIATRGGAEVLGRSDIGHIAPGMCADLALFDLRSEKEFTFRERFTVTGFADLCNIFNANGNQAAAQQCVK